MAHDDITAGLCLMGSPGLPRLLAGVSSGTGASMPPR